MSEKKFIGQVGRTIRDTSYEFEFTNKKPVNSPNILYILLDDLGFAGLGCYGSNIDTPNIDKLAKEGIRYNNFHTTAVCSATRASLLTGANHHAAGVANLIEVVTGCDNAQGHLDKSYATIAEILKEYDYATFASGKWHLSNSQTPSGPYDTWPLAKGFDRYYGFLKAEADHFHPQLVRDNSFVDQPKSSKDGYHLTEDITNNAIDFIFNHTNSFKDQPFFLYVAYGSTHAPHHAPKKYIDKYKGKFDDGWDKIREKWLKRQKKLGIVPKEAELTERAPYVEAWDSLDEKHKKLYVRYMEAFAGCLDYTDEQIGRIIDYLKSIDQLDNTVVVFLSDNGASPEGGIEGKINRYTGLLMNDEGSKEAEFALKHFNDIGGEYSFNQYPSGWANACNTPFQWYKYLSYNGGVKDPLIIRYPKLIKDKGGIRSQYHHVSDITPTVLDILGVKKPEIIKGVPQRPFTGMSFKYTFDDKKAKDKRHVQYYEVMGNRGIYKDGWKAMVNHIFNDNYKDDVWELYHVAEDYSEKYNVADKYPDKLRELQEEFFLEAGRNNVFPLVMGAPAGGVSLFGEYQVPETELVYKNIFKPYRLHESALQTFCGGDHYVSAVINRKHKEDGVILSFGERFGGYTFYIINNRLKYVYNANRFAYYEATSDKELPSGKITVKFEYKNVGKDGAKVVLYVNDKKSGEANILRRYHMNGCYATPTIRADFYTETSPEYEVPFEFKGDILEITIHSYGVRRNSKDEIMQILEVE